MPKELELILKDESATSKLGEIFSAFLNKGILYLRGDLGAGKTSFSQALIRAAGFEGRVKSPTYTLVEPYELPSRNIYHFDLYRLQDEEELLFLGCDEYFDVLGNNTSTLCLIEWPEKASSVLPLPDIELRIEHIDSSDAERGRRVQLSAFTTHGEQSLNAMHVDLQCFI